MKGTDRVGAALAEVPDRSAVYLCGGALADGKMTGSTMRWRRGEWEPIDASPTLTPRCFHTLTIRTDHVGVVFGGQFEKGLFNDLWLVDFNLQTPSFVLEHTKGAPRRRYGHTCAFLPDETGILLIGGMSFQSELRDCHIFNVPTRRWREVCTLPSPRAFQAAALASSGELYLFGGIVNGAASSSLLVCDTNQLRGAFRSKVVLAPSDVFKELQSINPRDGPSPRYKSAALVLPDNRTLIIVGGSRKPLMEGFPKATGGIFMLDVSSLEWRKHPADLAVSRSGHCAFVRQAGAHCWCLHVVGCGPLEDTSIFINGSVCGDASVSPRAERYLGFNFNIEVARHPAAVAFHRVEPEQDVGICEKKTKPKEEPPAAVVADPREMQLAEKYLVPWLVAVRRRLMSQNPAESPQSAAVLDRREVYLGRKYLMPWFWAVRRRLSAQHIAQNTSAPIDVTSFSPSRDMNPLLKPRTIINRSALPSAFAEISSEPRKSHARLDSHCSNDNPISRKHSRTVGYMSLLPLPTLGTRRSLRARQWSM